MISRPIPSSGEVVLLGKPAASGGELPEIWREFYRFNSGIAVRENVPRTKFGFAWYCEKLKEESAPIWVSYRGHRFDQQQHELLFDGITEELVVVWRYSLPDLDRPDSISGK